MLRQGANHRRRRREQRATGAAIESALTPLVGRVGGGALGGGPAAVVFQTAQMAFSDQQYSAMDYAAKDTRAAVAGTFSGALAAAAGFAVAGSVAPGVGTAIGFAVGLASYFLFDYDFGDEIESGVRSLGEPTNDPSGFFDAQGVDDPSGFFGVQDF